MTIRKQDSKLPSHLMAAGVAPKGPVLCKIELSVNNNGSKAALLHLHWRYLAENARSKRRSFETKHFVTSQRELALTDASAR